MGIVVCVVVCVLSLGLGALLGVAFANSRHKAQRGHVMAQTLKVAREIIYSEMASQEFHMAVMSVVHPDAIPNDGYAMVQVHEDGQMIVDADQWLMGNAPQPPRRKAAKVRQARTIPQERKWYQWPR
jgi:hypothetical protein